MALTKADMAESLFNELGLNKREARELVDLYFEELRANSCWNLRKFLIWKRV